MIDEITGSSAFWQRKPEAVEARALVYFKTYCYDRAACGRLNLNYTEQTAANGSTITRRLLYGVLQHYDIQGQLARVQSPTLIIHGDYDPIPLDTARRLHETLPHSTLVVLPHCGHFPYLEVPGEFFRQVRTFLQQLSHEK